MFRKDTDEFHLQMFDTTIVGALRRRCFPIWGNNRAADSRPYADGATELPEQKFLGCVVGVVPSNYPGGYFGAFIRFFMQLLWMNLSSSMLCGQTVLPHGRSWIYIRNIRIFIALTFILLLV